MEAAMVDVERVPDPNRPDEVPPRTPDEEGPERPDPTPRPQPGGRLAPGQGSDLSPVQPRGVDATTHPDAGLTVESSSSHMLGRVDAPTGVPAAEARFSMTNR
jgi:hypothetical protein